MTKICKTKKKLAICSILYSVGISGRAAFKSHLTTPEKTAARIGGGRQKHFKVRQCRRYKYVT